MNNLSIFASTVINYKYLGSFKRLITLINDFAVNL